MTSFVYIRIFLPFFYWIFIIFLIRHGTSWSKFSLNSERILFRSVFVQVFLMILDIIKNWLCDREDFVGYVLTFLEGIRFKCTQFDTMYVCTYVFFVCWRISYAMDYCLRYMNNYPFEVWTQYLLNQHRKKNIYKEENNRI